jgi:hypothetical protein
VNQSLDQIVVGDTHNLLQEGRFRERPPAEGLTQTIQFAVPNCANRVPGVPLYRKTPYPGVTISGTKQWLNPDAFVSAIDPTTGARYTGVLGVQKR